MGRAKQKMELISNEKARYITYQKRKKGLSKKAYELSTLCDVDVGMIIYGPDQTKDKYPAEAAEIWPPNDPDKIINLIHSYKNQASEGHAKGRTLNLYNFFHNRNSKIESELEKLRKKNDEAKYSTWDARYDTLSKEQLRDLHGVLDNKLQYVKARVAFMKAARNMNNNNSSSSSNSSISHAQYNRHNFLQGLMMGGTTNLQYLEAMPMHDDDGYNEQQPTPLSIDHYYYPYNYQPQGDAHSGVINNPLAAMMMPAAAAVNMNSNGHHDMNQRLGSVGGVLTGSCNNFVCNQQVVLDRPTSYNYDPTVHGMLENLSINNPMAPPYLEMERYVYHYI